MTNSFSVLVDWMMARCFFIHRWGTPKTHAVAWQYRAAHRSPNFVSLRRPIVEVRKPSTLPHEWRPHKSDTATIKHGAGIRPVARDKRLKWPALRTLFLHQSVHAALSQQQRSRPLNPHCRILRVRKGRMLNRRNPARATIHKNSA